MPNNSITWGIDLLPSTNNTYCLGDTNLNWKIFGNLTGNADTATTASKLTTSDVGSNIIPIYLDDGVATAGKTYAGGTAVTLNDVPKAENTAEFYAPTTAGTSGYILKSNGSGAPTWLQTLPVANGGTGANSFTADSLIMSGSTSTSALTTRAITDNTSNTEITHNNTNIPTMNTIYYGLVTVNGSSQTRATGIYAPTSAGTSGYILKSEGSGAPTWLQILPIANGGTGATSITAYGIIYGNSDGSAYTSAACNAEGKVIVSHSSSNNIAAPSWYNGLSLTSSTSNNTTTYAANFLGTVDIDGATTISGNTTINNSGTLTVAGNTTLSSALSVAGNTTIGTDGTASTLNVYGATTLHSTLSVTSTSTLMGNVGIGTSAESGTSAHKLSISGTSKLNGNVGIGANADSTFKLYVNGNSKFNGNIIPQINQTYSLGEGTTPLRWSSIYVGSANSYGDAYTPIYWNSGVPEAVMPTQYEEFSFTTGTGSSQTINLTSPAFTAQSYVLEIVVDTGEEYLQDAISWTSSAGMIQLTTKVQSSQTVSGYIIVSRGGEAPAAS